MQDSMVEIRTDAATLNEAAPVSRSGGGYLPITVIVVGFILTFGFISFANGLLPAGQHDSHSQPTARFVDRALIGKSIGLPPTDVSGRPLPKGLPLYVATLSCSSCQKVPASLVSVKGTERHPVVFVANDEAEALKYDKLNRKAFLVAAASVRSLPPSMLNSAPQVVVLQPSGLISQVLGPDSDEEFVR